MPRGLRRFSGSGDLHFITCSCYQRQPLLGTARRRDLFVRVLEQTRRRYCFVVLGFVVMPEHIHLLISETGPAHSFGCHAGPETRLCPTRPGRTTAPA